MKLRRTTNDANFLATLYSVPAQETAKHRAKFDWIPVNDVAAVTKPKR